MDSIGITAIAYALPETHVDLATLAERGLLESRASVLAEFGFDRVHISQQPADELALIALGRLIGEQHLDPDSIDAIFFAGAIPLSHSVGDGEAALDAFSYPVARLQYECGLMNATAIGVSQCGCTGLMTAVVLAADHLRANPDAHRVICVSADVLPAAARREIIYNVISDGACAVLVEPHAGRNRILGHRQITKGYYWNAGVSRNEIVAAYFPTARALLRDTLHGIGLEASDVAVVIPHNVSLRSWQILLPMLGLSVERLFADNIPRTGHVIAADNFINLKDATDAGRVRSGDRLLLFTFGFGANWACMILEA